MSDIKVFCTSGFDPFAVFRFGAEPFEITKASAAKLFRENMHIEFGQDELEKDASEPDVFYIRHDGSNDEYSWDFCSKSSVGAVPCFGVTWR